MKPITNLFNKLFNMCRPKRKYTKRTYKEKDCEVSYHPEILYYANLPYAEYIDYVEI